jgi:hypothetical protein
LFNVGVNAGEAAGQAGGRGSGGGHIPRRHHEPLEEEFGVLKPIKPYGDDGG